MRAASDFCWDKLHHCYTGAFIIFAGYFLKNNWIVLIGVLIVLDDIIEHTVTEDTPLRIIYEKSIQNKLPNCGCGG